MPKKTTKPAPAPATLIDGDMLVGEVMSLVPGSDQIMQDFGLHCTSCSVNVFEPLKMGAMSHGLSEEVVDDMISRINELALTRRKAAPDGIYVTANAAEKIKEFSKAEDKEGWHLRITAKDNGGREPAYGMDFEEKAVKGDTAVEFHGVQILMDKESFKNLQGAEVDFLETAYGSGFKITNPHFTKKSSGSGCGCGGTGGCGCGGNSTKESDDSCGCEDDTHEEAAAH